MNIDINAILQSDLIWQILIALAMLLLFRSVPKETLDKLEKRATETESTADDMAIKVLRWLNANKELLPEVLPSIPTLPAPTPPTTTVSHPPVGNTGTSTMDMSTPPFTEPPTDEFMDTFGKRGANSYTWQEKGHDRAVIEIPDGYDYRLDNRDANGTTYPYKAVNTNDTYGTRLNVSYVAGKHTFIRTNKVHLGTGKHELVLQYVADVKDKEGGQPMHNWLWSEAYIDGQPVLIGTDTINHRALENGAHVASWAFTNDTARDVTLSFTITVHYASAQANSAIDLKAFGLKRAS